MSFNGFAEVKPWQTYGLNMISLTISIHPIIHEGDGLFPRWEIHLLWICFSMKTHHAGPHVLGIQSNRLRM